MMKTYDFTKARLSLKEIENRAAKRAAAIDVNYGMSVITRVDDEAGEGTERATETEERTPEKKENQEKTGRSKKKA